MKMTLANKKKNPFLKVLVVTIFSALLLTGCGMLDSKKPEATGKPGEDGLDLKDTWHLSKAFVEAFLDEDFERMLEMPLTPQMKKALSSTTLAEIHSKIGKQFGSSGERRGYVTSSKNGFGIFQFAVGHEKSYLIYQVTIDSKGDIAGFFYNILPDESLISENWDEAPAVEVAELGNDFEAVEISFGDPQWLLKGTLTKPRGKGPFPTVVIVHGSGPSDRDGTLYVNTPYKDIAEGLARQGIASLRYDKRTYLHAQALGNSSEAMNFTIYDETIDDAQYAVEALLDESSVDANRIFVLGHSLGGNQSLRIAKGQDHIAGLIIMAGNVTPLPELMLRQYQYIFELDGGISEAEEQQINQVRLALEVLNAPDYSESVAPEKTFGIGYAYWKDLVHYSPIPDALELRVPILILQGSRDYQVDLREFQLWKEGLSQKEGVTFRLYEGLNHLFMLGKGAPNPGEYQIPSKVDSQVITEIAEWIKAHEN